MSENDKKLSIDIEKLDKEKQKMISEISKKLGVEIR